MTTAQQHNDFKAAKEIALNIAINCMRRAAGTNYTGANINGRMFVIGDTDSDIKNPDCFIQNKPAREVFGDFTIMYK